METSRSSSSPTSMTTKIQWDGSTYEKHESLALIQQYMEAYPTFNLITLEPPQEQQITVDKLTPLSREPWRREQAMAHLPHRLGQLLEYGMVSSLEDMIHITKYLAAVAQQVEYAPNHSGGCLVCLDLRLGASLRELMRVEELNNAYGPIFRSSVAIALLRDTAQNLCPEHDEAAQKKAQQARYGEEKTEESVPEKAGNPLYRGKDEYVAGWKDL